MLSKEVYPGVLSSTQIYQASLRMNFHGSWGIFLNVGGHSNGISGIGAGWVATSDESTLIPLLSSNHRVLGTIRWNRQSRVIGRGMVYFGTFVWQADLCSVYGLHTSQHHTARQAVQLPLMDTSLPDATDPLYRSAMSSIFEQIAEEERLSEERQLAEKEKQRLRDAEAEEDLRRMIADQEEAERYMDASTIHSRQSITGEADVHEEADSQSDAVVRTSLLTEFRVVSGSVEIQPGIFEPGCQLLERINEEATR